MCSVLNASLLDLCATFLAHSLHNGILILSSCYVCHCRLYGSYESLKGGKTSEAMVDFTGGLVESFDLKKKEDTEGLFKKMTKFSKINSFMSCSIRYAS